LYNKKESTKQLHIRLPNNMYKRLKVRCVHDDISMQYYVSQLITASLDGLLDNGNTKGQSQTGNKAK
jgi:predicted DNA-binding protein